MDYYLVLPILEIGRNLVKQLGKGFPIMRRSWKLNQVYTIAKVKYFNDLSNSRIPQIKQTKQFPGRIWGITGQDSSVSKSNQLHVVIFQVFPLSNLRYILQIPPI